MAPAGWEHPLPLVIVLAEGHVPVVLVPLETRSEDTEGTGAPNASVRRSSITGPASEPRCQESQPLVGTPASSLDVVVGPVRNGGVLVGEERLDV